MKHIIHSLTAIILLIATGCSSNDAAYDEMPQKISEFVAQYYPNSAVETFTASSTTYKLVIKNGPTMIFDKECSWEMVNGNGSTLPQNFLFNELPPEVYAYLQETEDLSDVFSVERDSKDYTIILLKDTLTYDIATGEITGG